MNKNQSMPGYVYLKSEEKDFVLGLIEQIQSVMIPDPDSINGFITTIPVMIKLDRPSYFALNTLLTKIIDSNVNK